MTAESKREILRAVEATSLPVNRTLTQLGIPRSTYDRWRSSFRRRGRAGLHDQPSARRRSWNRILPDERDRVLQIALLYPEWSSREVSCHITDECGFTISASSVYRILKAEDLIPDLQQKTFPAGSEYAIKTTAPDEQWQTDATYLLVKNWGWYYLISVLDDFSRRILAWRLQPSMTDGDFSEVIEAACEATRVEDLPTENVRGWLPTTDRL